MKRAISSFILRLFGWTVEVDVPDYPKCVICVAPHTSNWDFFIGKLAYLSIGRYAGFMMKKEWFFPPLGSLLKSMGGVPVSRDRHTDMVAQLDFQISKAFFHSDNPGGYPQGECRLEERLLLYSERCRGSYCIGLYRL